MRYLRKNTAVIVTVGPFYDKTDGVTIETALTITNERITLTADTDDGSAPTNILDNVTGATSGTSNDLNYITGNDAGMMQLELAAADTNRLGRMLLSVTDAANHVPVFHEFMVVNSALYDSLFATSGGAIPNAVAGASAGLLISGSNSGTTTLGALTVTGATTHTGNVVLSDGLTISAPSTSNRAGITVTGNGTGAGVSVTSGNGATGNGMDIIAAATNSKGLNISGLGSGAGMLVTGGATGHGVSAVGGATSGNGLNAAASTSGTGITATGVGTAKSGIAATGGATASDGITATGGGAGHGIDAVSGGSGTANGILGQSLATNGQGMELLGVGSRSGLRIQGGATGIGMEVVGGGTSGDGLKVTTTSGHGINLAPVGTSKHGLFTTGGNGGTSDGVSAVAGTGGVPIRGNITGNITGTIDTVTTATNVTTVNGLAANVITATSINNDAITAAKIANAAIDLATFASDVGNLSMRSSTATAGGATTITLDAGASASDDFYNNTLIMLTGGTGVGQSRFISDYVGSTKVATVATWVTNPDNTTTFSIMPFDAVAGASAPTVAQIATGVWQDATAGDFTAASSIGKALYVSNVAPGGSGGHMISGSNSGTTTLGALTVTGATTHTGNVVLSDGLTVSAPSTSNRAGVTVTGNGTGAGISVTGGNGATGNGVTVTANSTNGNGIAATGTGTGDGLIATGGASAGGDGISAIAGGGTDLRAVAITGTLATVTTATTATNLTNAPTAGDFTATMKTSIGTAVAASAVASVTGNVGGNVVGSVGSVTGAVGSVTGAVGSVTGNVGGNVVGSVGSVTGAVGSVTGNVGGNVVGSVASVTAGVTIAASQLFIKKNTQATGFPFKMVLSSDGVTPATGKTVTATRSIDGGAFASCANSVTEISSGWYKITLADTDLNGTFIALKFSATACNQRDMLVVTQA